MKVGKGFAQIGIKLSHTRFVRSSSGLSSVIHKIIRKKLLKEIEIPFALYLLYFGEQLLLLLRILNCCSTTESFLLYFVPSPSENAAILLEEARGFLE
jgi:hypothetical protein